MEINFKGPVMPVDHYSQMAFVEILNRQPLYPVATGGIQLAALLQPAHIQHPFRDAGKP